MSLENVVLVLGGTLSGLMAGVFYTFNVAIIPAMRHISGKRHIAFMQSLNDKIENPVFFLSFFGPTALLPLAAYLHRASDQFPLVLIAALLHIIGANGVTVAANIPLNRKLAEINVEQVSEEEADRLRQEYQGPGSPWMRWHNVRTLASIAATVLIFIACLGKD